MISLHVSDRGPLEMQKCKSNVWRKLELLLSLKETHFNVDNIFMLGPNSLESSIFASQNSLTGYLSILIFDLIPSLGFNEAKALKATSNKEVMSTNNNCQLPLPHSNSFIFCVCEFLWQYGCKFSLHWKTHFDDRDLPIASTSSMYKIHGASFLARVNKSLTLAEPTPENTSTKSDPAMVRNGTSASVATALASRVLPVPGGPTRRAP